MVSLEDVVEHGRLAGTEEAGEQGERDAIALGHGFCDGLCSGPGAGGGEQGVFLIRGGDLGSLRPAGTLVTAVMPKQAESVCETPRTLTSRWRATHEPESAAPRKRHGLERAGDSQTLWAGDDAVDDAQRCAKGSSAGAPESPALRAF
ncbi:hypothetical protein FGB62_87g051 [Gracilaria domingensis]|nr:hypothetical protein FGB62_87g051 [Gracilaria domingensis]